MKERLMEDLKTAMKARQPEKVASIKSVRQAVIGFEKDNPGKELTEDVFASLVDGLIKTRTKSIEEYTKADRLDLAEPEQVEIDFIKVYLPERVNEETIREFALATKTETGASSMQDMGMMMGKLKAHFGATAKPADISKIVKEILS